MEQEGIDYLTNQCYWLKDQVREMKARLELETDDERILIEKQFLPARIERTLAQLKEYRHQLKEEGVSIEFDDDEQDE